MQYLLRDPTRSVTGSAGFASGLVFTSGVKKATYFAFNLPVWMPTTSFSHRRKVEVWGDARPAVFERHFGPQSVAIQLQRKGQPFVTLNTVKVRANGYFDIRMKFPASGAVRLVYTYPTGDLLLPATARGSTIASRSFNIKVR